MQEFRLRYCTTDMLRLCFIMWGGTKVLGPGSRYCWACRSIPAWAFANC